MDKDLPSRTGNKEPGFQNIRLSELFKTHSFCVRLRRLKLVCEKEVKLVVDCYPSSRVACHNNYVRSCVPEMRTKTCGETITVDCKCGKRS